MFKAVGRKTLSHFSIRYFYSNKNIMKGVFKEIEWEGEDLFKLAQDRNTGVLISP